MEAKDQYKFSKKERESVAMRFCEPFDDKYTKVRGAFEARIFEGGETIYEHVDHNVIVLIARKTLAHLAGEADSDYQLTHFAMGDGHHIGGPGQGGDLLTEVAPLESELTLEQELFRKAIDTVTYPDDTSVKFTTTIDQAEGQATVISSGAADSLVANKLVNSGATFEADGVRPGMLVTNTTDVTTALVTAVDSETQLSLDTDIFDDGDEDYEVALHDPCAYTEAAIFTPSSVAEGDDGRMFCIKSFPAMIKNASREFEFRWTLLF